MKSRPSPSPSPTAIARHVRHGPVIRLPALVDINFPGYINLSPPKYEEVVADCDEALRLDPKYVKALNRRASALEALDRYEEALRGERSTLGIMRVHTC